MKSQQRFRSKNHVFTKEINKIALSDTDDERMRSIDLIETNICGTSKDFVCKKKKETKCNNIIKQCKK